jgi:L-malate glycosyltransferase
MYHDGLMKILHVTCWYPNELRPTQGIFIKRHIEAVSPFVDDLILVLDQGSFGPLRLVKRKKILRAEIGKRGVARLLGGIIVAFRLGRQTSTVDIVHAHAHSALIPAYILARMLKAELVYTEHSSTFTSRGFKKIGGLEKLLFGLIARKATTSAVSSFLAEGMKKIFKLKVSPVIVYNVVDEQFSRNKISGFPNAARRIITISPNLKVKRPDLLALALATMKVKAEILIIGDGYGQKWWEFIKYLKIENRVSHIPYANAEKICIEMLHSSLYLQTSDCETFGVGIAEALAIGLPVVTTASGGPEEYAVNAGAFVTPSGDPVALARALDDRLVSPLVVNPFMRNECSSDKIGRKFLDVYKMASCNE